MIHVTFLQCSVYEHGYPVEYYCDQCKQHTFLWHPFLIKPTDGDYFRIQFCPDHEEHNWNWTKIWGQDVQIREMKWPEEKVVGV